jgi:hypothetical protein
MAEYAFWNQKEALAPEGGLVADINLMETPSAYPLKWGLRNRTNRSLAKLGPTTIHMANYHDVHKDIMHQIGDLRARYFHGPDSVKKWDYWLNPAGRDISTADEGATHFWVQNEEEYVLAGMRVIKGNPGSSFAEAVDNSQFLALHELNAGVSRKDDTVQNAVLKKLSRNAGLRTAILDGDWLTFERLAPETFSITSPDIYKNRDSQLMGAVLTSGIMWFATNKLLERGLPTVLLQTDDSLQPVLETALGTQACERILTVTQTKVDDRGRPVSDTCHTSLLNLGEALAYTANNRKDIFDAVSSY